VEHLLVELERGDVEALSRYLQYWQLRYGAQALMIHLLPKLLKSIGDHWQVGSMKIHQEHLMTELLQTHLRNLLTLWSAPSKPLRFLLTTLPEEKHGLGLLLSENLMRMEGFSTISLGLQTPVESMVHACRDHQIDILCLSVSEANTSSLTVSQVVMLDQKLPSHVRIWLGGEGARRLPVQGDRIDRVISLEGLLTSLQILSASLNEKAPTP